MTWDRAGRDRVAVMTARPSGRVGDGRADYSHKYRRHGVNVQVVTDPGGRLLWLSPALPGRTHDLTAARAHRSTGSASVRAFPSWPISPAKAPAPG